MPYLSGGGIERVAIQCRFGPAEDVKSDDTSESTPEPSAVRSERPTYSETP